MTGIKSSKNALLLENGKVICINSFDGITIRMWFETRKNGTGTCDGSSSTSGCKPAMLVLLFVEKVGICSFSFDGGELVQARDLLERGGWLSAAAGRSNRIQSEEEKYGKNVEAQAGKKNGR